MTSMKKGKKDAVLLTGCSGLIGSRLAHRLAADFQVVGFDVNAPSTFPKQAAWFECDLTDHDSVQEAISLVLERFGSSIASVVHLAAYYDFSGESNKLYRTLTVEGTRRLINALRLCAVEQFIFSSSLLVMKPVPDEDSGKLSESSEVQAEWDYPRSKLEAESVIKNEQPPFPTVILRIAGVYTDYCNSIPLSRHISRIYEQKLESYFFPGDADHGQPFVHLEDLVDCLYQTIVRRNSLPREALYLIAEPELMSHRDLQEHIGRLIHGKAWPTYAIPKSFAKAGAWLKDTLSAEEEFIKPWMIELADDHYPVQITSARLDLGWDPKRNLKYSLRQMIDALYDDPRKWYRAHNLTLPEKFEDITASSAM